MVCRENLRRVKFNPATTKTDETKKSSLGMGQRPRPIVAINRLGVTSLRNMSPGQDVKRQSIGFEQTCRAQLFGYPAP